jgi:ATP/ADP translocase
LEYVHYLIYPIAGLLCLLALGGLNTKHPIVVIASMISLSLNGYAIFAFVWWPIPASLVSDFIFKRLFGDPGVGN